MGTLNLGTLWLEGVSSFTEMRENQVASVLLPVRATLQATIWRGFLYGSDHRDSRVVQSRQPQIFSLVLCRFYKVKLGDYQVCIRGHVLCMTAVLIS